MTTWYMALKKHQITMQLFFGWRYGALPITSCCFIIMENVLFLATYATGDNTCNFVPTQILPFGFIARNISWKIFHIFLRHNIHTFINVMQAFGFGSLVTY